MGKPTRRANVKEVFHQCEVCKGKRYLPVDDQLTSFEQCKFCDGQGLRLAYKEITHLNVPVQVDR